MADIPKSHPRYRSLSLRHLISDGLKAGLATEAALLAHGRGEAFYYLLGEKTHDFADEAIRAAAALIAQAKHPVFSVNGNTASLAGAELLELVKAYPRLKVEVNLFYHSEERSRRIREHLESVGLPEVLESCAADHEELGSIESPRRRMNPEGIAKADVVVVALEDGDRCQALVEAGKQVIAIDLNPLSRTAQLAQISITDELTQIIPLLAAQLQTDAKAGLAGLQDRLARYDNRANLGRAIAAIRQGT